MIVILGPTVFLLYSRALITVRRCLSAAGFCVRKRHGPQFGLNAHPNDFAAQVDQVVDRVLFRDREASVLEQPFPVLVWNTVSKEDVKRDDTDFVLVAVLRCQPLFELRSVENWHSRHCIVCE